MTRLRLFVLTCSLLMLSFPGAADAAVYGDNGTCHLHVTFTFSGTGMKMKSRTVAETSPPYTIAVSDVDLLPQIDGMQSCVDTLGMLQPFRETGITLIADWLDFDTWTCEESFALGYGEQYFDPSPPEFWDLNYIIVGTWGHWSIIIHDPVDVRFVAEIPLHFRDNADLTMSTFPACTDGSSGIGRIRLTGDEVWVDPRVE